MRLRSLEEPVNPRRSATTVATECVTRSADGQPVPRNTYARRHSAPFETSGRRRCLDPRSCATSPDRVRAPSAAPPARCSASSRARARATPRSIAVALQYFNRTHEIGADRDELGAAEGELPAAERVPAITDPRPPLPGRRNPHWAALFCAWSPTRCGPLLAVAPMRRMRSPGAAAPCQRRAAPC